LFTRLVICYVFNQSGECIVISKSVWLPVGRYFSFFGIIVTVPFNLHAKRRCGMTGTKFPENEMNKSCFFFMNLIQ